VRPAATRLLRRMRARALPPLQGAGLSEPGDRTQAERVLRLRWWIRA
jgi:hypothetical protein